LLMGKGFSIDNSGTSATVIEGSRTVKLMGEITRQKGVQEEYPLVQALYRLMYEGESINDYMAAVFA
ncbi:MAG: glycerol-3-phosphate dehydrogenase, partial [Clostridia bacterium]|nr:glycerol-3-phosphate dehydrogenase [Clostridia bacterium]